MVKGKYIFFFLLTVFMPHVSLILFFPTDWVGEVDVSGGNAGVPCSTKSTSQHSPYSYIGFVGLASYWQFQDLFEFQQTPFVRTESPWHSLSQHFHGIFTPFFLSGRWESKIPWRAEWDFFQRLGTFQVRGSEVFFPE